CEPECPWEAIFEDSAVPDVFKDDIELNVRMTDSKDLFRVPEAEERDRPTPEQIAENKKKWGFEG
ncbi:MAG: ferredoxin, partial [Deltaproteobacteria bacterium]|nr:ferredoxin [Deltaproteobacteria bacterium]